MHPRPRSSRRRRALLVLVPVVAVAAAAGIWLTTGEEDDDVRAGNDTPAAAPTTAPSDPDSEALASLGPDRTGGAPVPTEPPAEVATDAPVPTQDAGGEVTPQLTYYGWNADIEAVEAGGIVLGIVEAGGTCTLTMTQGTTTVDVSTTAIDNATSTSCPAMTVPGDQLEPGTWQATLAYESETSRGIAEAVAVEVP
ncbi:hypothetical protein [Blastococcus goldschmidtiae]|uniref:Uncharacterized protein n=1 Tax=Blastococcus goldschmidtiae TaxID=3075546 RepID=A0ABU2K4L2_9ACTN|nr:hypothetical protein [Blastococcus sp. DSM 46792]MDT0275114.1 hypothetical protein [Blastococcus sp. DSM 46792]